MFRPTKFPEVRYTTKKEAVLSTGVGLSGTGEFVPGSALVNRIENCNVNIDANVNSTTVEIGYIDNQAKTKDNPCSMSLLVQQPIQITVGPITGDKKNGSGVILINKNNVPANPDYSTQDSVVRLTAIDQDRTPSNPMTFSRYTGLACIEDFSHNLNLVVDSNGTTTLSTRFSEKTHGINKLTILSELKHDVTNKLHTDGRIGVHETIIGSSVPSSSGITLDEVKGGAYNIITAQNLMLNGRDNQTNSPYTDNDSIKFSNQNSALNIAANQNCEVTLGAPVKADVDGHGCVYLNSNNNVLSVKGASFGTPDCKLHELKQGNIQLGVEHYAYEDTLVSIGGNSSEAIVE